MIKNTELRVGNIVFNLFANAVVKEIYTDKASIMFATGKQDIVLLGYVQAIPLTDELLEKAGFGHRHVTFSDVEVPSYYQWELIGGNFCLHSDELKRIHSNAPLQHLHQLQNLYFALTGEELEIKLTKFNSYDKSK
jgi:hypothetical protein